MRFPQSSRAPSAPKPGAPASERHVATTARSGDGGEMEGRK
ncbi:hypothetical protein [Paraburkholderia caffeinilytica]|nr:hypothetical protein [Paraburkholderia caffeinilytica]CAB3783491.1 hypothetical protein LMG28690_01601 [Paraburkholderia caffeinilytica]